MQSRCLTVWIYILPPATAGVLWTRSPRAFVANNSNFSPALRTNTSPALETQKSRPSTDTGELKKFFPTFSCHTCLPELARRHVTAPLSLHRKSNPSRQTLVGTYG